MKIPKRQKTKPSQIKPQTIKSKTTQPQTIKEPTKSNTRPEEERQNENQSERQITQPTLNSKQYSKLLTDLKTLIENSAESLASSDSKNLIITYWQIGKRINQEPISNQNNYQNAILKDLSDELAIEKTTLSRSINFFKFYPELPKTLPLSWSHYRQLITIKDATIRKNLEEQTIKNKWNRNQLAASISKINHPTPETQTTILKRPTNPTYLYRAKVLDVVDGDTLILDIDLGFAVHKEQRIRLACLDCPEIKTQKGKEAYHFLRNKLTTINSLMIQTQKVDLYGRFLGHIFYDPTGLMNDDEVFAKGVYLNEEILREGLGEVV